MQYFFLIALLIGLIDLYNDAINFVFKDKHSLKIKEAASES